MEQFEQPVPFVQLSKRRDRGMGEAAVGFGAEFEQLVLGEGLADEGKHDPGRQLGIREPGESGDLRLGETRPFARNVEPAVGREARQRDAFEIERRGAAAGGDVFHGGSASSGGWLMWQQGGVNGRTPFPFRQRIPARA